MGHYRENKRFRTKQKAKTLSRSEPGTLTEERNGGFPEVWGKMKLLGTAGQR